MDRKKDFLKRNETSALKEMKRRLLLKFPNVEIILYGSKARGNYQKFSDIDLLILIDKQVTSKIKEDIIRIAYDLELQFDVVFGIVIENKDFWSSSLGQAMPFHRNIEKDGIPI